MPRLACTILILLGWPFAPAAEEPAPAANPVPASGVTSAPTAIDAPGSPASPAAAPVAAPAPKPFSLQVGWGYYEVLHAGATWHHSARGAVELFGGAGFAGGKETGTFGLGYRHHVGPPFVWALQAGWDVKALYWGQSDSRYDWKMMSFVTGGYVTRAIDSRLSLKLDAGVALNVALESDRKQDESFGTPQRWNGSVCLELVYRLGAR